MALSSLQEVAQKENKYYSNTYTVIVSFIRNREILPLSLSASSPLSPSLCYLLIHYLYEPVLTHLLQFYLSLPLLLLPSMK